MRRSRRRPVAGRRPEPQRAAPEASAIPWPRVLGVLGMVAVVGVGAWFLGDPTFRVDPRAVTVTGARFTDESAIRARTGLFGEVRPSVFVLATRRMESDLEAMPTVARADVTATLPDRVAISIVERTPMVAWLVGDDGFLVDVEGIVLGPTSAIDATELGDGSTGSDLPAITDARAGSQLVPGEQVDQVDLEAIRLLGAVTPEMIGSQAPGLTLSVDDDSGYVLEWPDHWRAVFGHYTRTLLPPDRIPAQVQCLGELLREREDSVAGATLAVSADRCGTFLPGTVEPTRRPRRTPRPTKES